MRELIETLRNTGVSMTMEPCEFGMWVIFKVMIADEPFEYKFIISDVELADMYQVFDIEKYILSKLEWMFKRLGVQIHA